MTRDTFRIDRCNEASRSGREPAKRARRRNPPRLRPGLLELESRQLLAQLPPIVVNNPTDTPIAGQIDLRQAIAEANTNGGDSTITFDATVFATPTRIALTQGELELSTAGEDVTVQGPAAGLTISGGGQSRVFQVGDGVTATLSGLTLTDGYVNTGPDGGHLSGSGLYNEGTTTLNDCTISGNSAAEGSALQNGGFYNDEVGTLILTDCTISGNSSPLGAGGLNNLDKATLTGCTISGNSTGVGGGGLFNDGTATLTDCTISGNSANVRAGGLYSQEGALALTGCTVSGNTAYSYSGLDVYTTTTLTDTIVAGNVTRDGSPSDIGGRGLADAVGTYNLIGPGGSGGISNGTGGNIVLTSLADLGLAPLGSNGGLTQTMALLPGSAAIGKGTAVSDVTTDQRGFPLDSPDPDIGAFQTQVLVATSTQIAAPVDPATVGQTVVFTATVAPAGGRGTPTGTVTFTIDGQAEPPSALSVVDGVDEASFSTASLAVGAHTIDATYSGDDRFASSTATPPLTETIDAPALQPTLTLLSTDANPSNGAIGVFTVTVEPTTGSGVPTGTVTLTINGVSEMPLSLAEVNGKDQAGLAIPTMPSGTYTITAVYSGDTVFAPSHSSPLIEVVHSTLTTTTSTTAYSTDGPRILSVRRYGYHMMPTTVVLAFDEALDAMTAEDVDDYRIIGPGGRTIAIKRAVYDPATLTVTLHPSQRISVHHRYKLIIDGTGPHGLTNTSGQLLDGTDSGTPDSDARTTLTGRNLVLDPVPKDIWRWDKKKTGGANLKPAADRTGHP
jgi:Bacterial Ig-like domain (group 3)